MNDLPRDKEIEAIAALTEGVSIRVTERPAERLSSARRPRYVVVLAANGTGACACELTRRLDIDWLKDPSRAACCTTIFAAVAPRASS